MSLITRCPACGTMFKVVPDQLRISEGWVRCGHCTDVFDASAHLQPDASSQPAAQVHAEATPTEEWAAPESEVFASSLNTEIDEGMPLEAPDSALLHAEAQALIEQPLDQPFELRRQDPGEAEQEALRTQRMPERESEPEPELHDLSFVRQARRKQFWRRPVVRILSLLALLALAILLALQIAVHERDRLAASDPALRPMLAGLCGALDCSIHPPRQIDAIVIDGSSFNKLRGDAYRLNVTLKNQAALAVAMPALELTLTDAQDQAVVRRVLLPAELAANPGVIGAGSEWSGSMALALAANGAEARVAGYRLFAFYP